MRILLAGDSTSVISGFGSALRNLATYLHRRGHTVAHLGWQTPGQERIASFGDDILGYNCLLYTSPSPRDLSTSRMPSSA